MPDFVDLRSSDEIAMEKRGKSPLEDEDEAVARKLLTLLERTDLEYDNDKTAYERIKDEIRAVGEQLCSDGGDARMKQVAYRVKGLGRRGRELEMYWDGICGWMA